MRALPSQSAARASRCSLPRAAAPTRTTSTELPESQAERVRACCSARISVGTISAACHPDSTASIMAAKATAVLPLPTSPCRSRFIGSGRPMSCAISPSTRACARVRANGRGATARASASGEASKRIPGSTLTPARRRAIASCRKKSSSKMSRRKAGVARASACLGSVPAPGKWASRSASARPRSALRARTSEGRSSTAKGASSSQSRFMSLRRAGCW